MDRGKFDREVIRQLEEYRRHESVEDLRRFDLEQRLMEARRTIQLKEDDWQAIFTRLDYNSFPLQPNVYFAELCAIAAGTEHIADYIRQDMVEVSTERFQALDMLKDEYIASIIEKNEASTLIVNSLLDIGENCGELELKRAAKIMDQHNEDLLIPYMFSRFAVASKRTGFRKLLDLYEKHGDKFKSLPMKVLDLTNDPIEIEMGFRVIEKYKDNKVDKIFSALRKGSEEPISLNQKIAYLLEDRAYIQIEKSAANIHHVIGGGYFDVLMEIDEEEVRNHVSYNDLGLIEETYKFVKEIHRKRSDANKLTIGTEFYKELNRAIGQGNDLKQKYGNIREYCADVKRIMREHAQELLVMTNE